MDNLFQEVRYPLGDGSDRMVTLSVFHSRIKIHIRQFYVDNFGEKRPGKTGITMSVKEFDALMKLIPLLQQDIDSMNSRLSNLVEEKTPRFPFPVIEEEPICPVLNTSFLPTPPLQDLVSFLENEEILDSLPKLPSHPSPVPDTTPFVDPTLERILNDLREEEKPKSKKRRTKENTVKREKRRKNEHVKRECIDEVDSIETMREVEQKLWLVHYDLLNEELMKITREKCTGCQNDEPNQLAHELCLLASSEVQVDVCFDEAYRRVNWNTVMDRWYEKVLEMPIALNPETLIIFRETINPEELTYKNRMKKWMNESPTIEL